MPNIKRAKVKGWKSLDEFKAYGITCLQEGRQGLIELIDKYFQTEPWMTKEDWQALKLGQEENENF